MIIFTDLHKVSVKNKINYCNKQLLLLFYYSDYNYNDCQCWVVMHYFCNVLL